MPLPPTLPNEVFSHLGPVPVEYRYKLKPKKWGRLFGLFKRRSRRILVDTHPPFVQQWHTVMHEKIHVWLFDAGVSSILSRKQEEAVCDAVATALIAEMKNG
jgi:Zn-dependent peptidase ImmA (M78 family)